MKLLSHSILLLSLIAALWSCGDLLGIRDVEPPDGLSQSHWVPAASPELLVQNLINSFKYREYESYLKTFADTTLDQNSTFQFKANANSLAAFPGIFDNWTLSDEQIYFQGIISGCPSDSLLSLSLKEDEPYTLSGDSISYQLSYTIEVHHNRENIPKVFSGRSIFHLIQNTSNYWVINYWEDIYTGTDSWSDLKALF